MWHLRPGVHLHRLHVSFVFFCRLCKKLLAFVLTPSAVQCCDGCPQLPTIQRLVSRVCHKRHSQITHLPLVLGRLTVRRCVFLDGTQNTCSSCQSTENAMGRNPYVEQPPCMYHGVASRLQSPPNAPMCCDPTLSSRRFLAAASKTCCRDTPVCPQ